MKHLWFSLTEVSLSLPFLEEVLLDKLILGDNKLDVPSLEYASRNVVQVELSSLARNKIDNCRCKVEQISEADRPIYGLNTGFGSLAQVKIPNNDLSQLQANLIHSHTAAVGDSLPLDVVKGAMILRANALANGYSGLRSEVVDLMLMMVNCNIIPSVPMWGSVGASGDLALLSTIAGCMMKSNEQYDVFRLVGGIWLSETAEKAFRVSGLKPVNLLAKEGLALNNGCQVSTSMAALALADGIKALRTWDIASALSSQALLANSSPFDARISIARPHPGQIRQSNVMRALLKGSKLIDADKSKIQDAYSIRCIPQVGGAVRDAINYAKNTIEIEMNASTDNPLIFDEVISGGNFHGAPIALVSDLLSIAFTDLASMSERRTFRLVTRNLSGLPSFLTSDPGLSSGLMVPQYTAASLVSACKVLSHPASVDSIPTCENQEDHVSMAPISAWKLRQVVNNLSWVVSIELLTASQAIELRLKEMNVNSSALSESTLKAFKTIRQIVPFISYDQPLTPHLDKIHRLITSEALFDDVLNLWDDPV